MKKPIIYFLTLTIIIISIGFIRHKAVETALPKMEKLLIKQGYNNPKLQSISVFYTSATFQCDTVVKEVRYSTNGLFQVVE